MVKKSNCSLPPSWHFMIGMSVVVLSILFVYKLYNKKDSITTYMERFVEKEHFNGIKNCEGTTKPYSLIFFYMDSCPHCIDFKPVWEQVSKTVKSGKYADKLCLADVSAENDAILEKYNVSSFPTVLLVSNSGKSVVNFTGQRTPEGLLTFVSQNVS